MRQKRKSEQFRIFLLMALFLGAFAALGLRVAYIQLVEGEALSARASASQSRSVSIEPRRGSILDRNGEELAVSTVVSTISINPSTLRDSIADAADAGLSAAGVAGELARILRLDEDFVRGKIEAKSKYEVLKRKVESETADTLTEYLSGVRLAGVDFEEDSKRFYKNNNLAAHVIGMTTEDNRGLMGIEASMEQYIKGTPGMIKGDIDGRRAEVPLGDGSRIAVRDGQNVVLTIDTAIQLFATAALEKAIVENDVRRGGVVIVMDPRNGDILALVSKPDFDLNNPYAAPMDYAGDEWNGRTQADTDILNQTVWRNKAIMDTYEPGSTFKPFTVAAGLEEGVINLESEFVCEPITGYYDTPIGCWTHASHGVQDLTHAMYNSCNPALARISQRVELPNFYRYIRDFGFYDRTGIALSGESAGIFHTRPREVDMLVASFGQRFTITPIGLITAYAALANGGNLMRPRLVKELRGDDGSVTMRFDPEVIRKVISKDTSDKLRTILEGVVDEGTGKNAYVSGFRVAGKTGTSETTEEDYHIASFCAFAPADNPVLCALVMLDDPQGENGYMGGAVAAPVAQRLLEEVLTYMEVERVYSERDLNEQDRQTVIPDVRKMTVAEAVKALDGFELEYRLQGGADDDSLVIEAQTPQPYVSVNTNSVVVLYTGETTGRLLTQMPDLTNKTLYEAEAALKKAGLNIRAAGAGIAKAQSVEPGAEVEMGTIVEVSFRYTDNIE